MGFITQIESILALGTTEVGTGSSFPVFKGHMPDSTVSGSTNRAVALLHTPGDPDDGRVDREHQGLQIITRGAPLNSTTGAYEEAETAAFAIKNAMHGFTGESSSGSPHFVGIWSLSGPFFGGYDQLMRPTFSNNLMVQRSRP